MFRVIRYDLLLRYTIIATVLISLLIYVGIQLLGYDFEIFKVFTIASIVSTALIFILITPFFARRIWALIAWANKSAFPDLNGTWSGEIILEDKTTIPVRAVIRQSLLTTEIDVHGATMKSMTLETTPTIEHGQKKLYYVYRSTPKEPGRPAYNGFTLFDVRRIGAASDEFLELSGIYHTERKTVGRIRLKQECPDTNRDVSFY